MSVHAGRNAADAVRVMISPLGIERIPPAGRLSPEQPRRLPVINGLVGSGAAGVISTMVANDPRRSAMGMRRGQSFGLL